MSQCNFICLCILGASLLILCLLSLKCSISSLENDVISLQFENFRLNNRLHNLESKHGKKR